MKFKDAKRTNFVVGQVVEVVDNDGMVASLGATAVVAEANYGFKGYNLIGVIWKTNSNNQMDGGYQSYHFKPKSVRGEQLIFDFMER